jgi:hypothetical protein
MPLDAPGANTRASRMWVSETEMIDGMAAMPPRSMLSVESWSPLALS